MWLLYRATCSTVWPRRALASALLLALACVSCHALEGLVTGKTPGDLRVPAQRELALDRELNLDRVRSFCAGLLAEKEKAAWAELERMKPLILRDAVKAEADREDRLQRLRRYERTFGSAEVGQPANAAPAGPVHVRMTVYVPEAAVYARVAAVCTERAALAKDVVATLATLDADARGCLGEDQYKRAAALVRTTERLFDDPALDQAKELSLDLLEQLPVLPKDAKAAVREGLAAVQDAKYRIPGYDADQDGSLDVGERKTLALAYSAAQLRYTQAAAVYQAILTALTDAYPRFAARFESIAVERK